MAEVTEIMPLCRPAWVIDKRLRFHTTAGEMLAGMTYRSFPDHEEDGKGSFPYVRTYEMSMEENAGAGAWKGQSTVAAGNQPYEPSITLDMRIAVKRANGLCRVDPYDESKGRGLLEWVALVEDAIEIDLDGQTDARLEQSCGRPVIFEVSDTEVSQLTWAATLRVKCIMPFLHRGSRSEEAIV